MYSYEEAYAKALAKCQKKYGQGVDASRVERAVKAVLDMFADDEDIAKEAWDKVHCYTSYSVLKDYDKSSYPVEKLAVEAIVGKKFSGNLYARAKALTDWCRVQEGKDAVDVTRPSPLPQTKNKIGKVVTSYINQARKDKNNNHGLPKYAFKLPCGYTMYANSYVAVRTKEDWELDAAAYTNSIPVPKLDVWENINTQPSVAVRIDRYQVEVFADLGLQVDFKVAEGLSLYFVASQIMFLFKVLDAKSLVFYTPKAKTIEGRHPCYFGSVWYCQNEHGEAVFMPCKHDDDEHPIVCDISKQVQVINGKEVTMAKTKVEKVKEVKQTTKEVAPMKKSAKCKALENAAKKSAKVEAPTPQPSQFAGLTTMEQVRQRYMELIQQGIEPNMEQYTTAFNAAHDAELKAAQDSGKYIGRLLKEQSPTEGYLEAINVALQLAKNNGVDVKVEGCYIWISNTKREDMECRNALKGAGFWWARNRKQWYWRPAFFYKKTESRT